MNKVKDRNKNRAISIAKQLIPKESKELYYTELCRGCIYNQSETNVEAIVCCYCQDGEFYETMEDLNK